MVNIVFTYCVKLDYIVIRGIENLAVAIRFCLAVLYVLIMKVTACRYGQ